MNGVGSTRLAIEQTWDGRAVDSGERCAVDLVLERDSLLVRIDAPFHGDPSPTGPTGSFDGLWKFEVVEVFLLGEEERYLEVELSPSGHYLALQLQGRRNRCGAPLPIDFRCRREGSRWQGEARVPGSYLPPGLCAANAYSIHGTGDARRYLAAFPVGTPEEEPDFHRLGAFRPLRLQRS